MRMFAPILSLGLSLALCVGDAALAAQTPANPAPRNELGVAFNNVSLEVPDFDAHVRFWTSLGGVRREQPAAPGAPANAAAERFTFIEFPDMMITVRDGKGAGGTVGSVINHIGFQVPDTTQAVGRFQAAGLTVEKGAVPGQAFVTAPGDIRIEILQDPTLTVPIRGHHVHFFNAAPLETQAWYAKTFGAVPGKRAIFDAADITASKTVMNLTFSASTEPVAPTKGRALDHIGFMVNGLPAFLNKLQAQGVQVDTPMQLVANGRAGIAFILDPWGTRIQLIDQNPGPAR